MLDDSTSDRGSDRPEVLNDELPPGQCTVGEIRVFCPMGVLGVFI